MTDETLLLRQINPNFYQQGRVTSQAFRPTPKDKQKLSVYDGDLITAEMSWIHFRNHQKLESVGVLAVSVTECKGLSLIARSSPEHFPEHAEIDFLSFTNNECERKGKKLKGMAEQRGWQYQEKPGR